MADPTTTEWLLDGDPAVRWQVLGDLLDAGGSSSPCTGYTDRTARVTLSTRP